MRTNNENRFATALLIALCTATVGRETASQNPPPRSVNWPPPSRSVNWPPPSRSVNWPPPPADPYDFYAHHTRPRPYHEDYRQIPNYYRSPDPRGPADTYYPPHDRLDPYDSLGPHQRVSPSRTAAHYPQYESADFRDHSSRPHTVNIYVFHPQSPQRPEQHYSRWPDPYYYSRLSPAAVQTLHLDEGDFCRRGHGLYPDYWCVNAENCSEPLAESFRDDNVLDVCSFVGTEPIVCCPKPTIVEETPTLPAGPMERDAHEISSMSPIGPVRPSIDEIIVQDHSGPDVGDDATAETPTDVVGPPIAGADVNQQNSDAKPTHDDCEMPLEETNAKVPFPPTEETATAPGTLSPVSDETPSSRAPPKPSTEEASNNGDNTLSAALDDLFNPTEVPATADWKEDPTAVPGVQKAFSETTAEVFGPKLEETEKGPGTDTVADFDQNIIPSQTPAVNVVRPSIDKSAIAGDAGGPENNAQSLNIAIKKCRQYIAADYAKDNYNSGRKIMSDRKPDHSNEYGYPHMTIIGYGETAEDKNEWKCGGSLVSERWILTAAHCYKIGFVARWARLGAEYSPGVLDIRSAGNGARTKDYRIIRHVLHPKYIKPGHYDDIGLFYLDRDVEFSVHVRPICLNTDPSLSPSNPIATSWGGTTPAGERRNDVLFGAALDVIPANECKRSYSSIKDPKIRSSIRPDSMICASSSGEDDGDTCSGVPGGPLQIENVGNPDTYTLFGVTSFCGTRKYPGIYTRVSSYIRWIEGVVWPNDLSRVRPIIIG